MYKKEFMECLRRTINSFLFLIIIPVFYLFDRLFLDLKLDYEVVFLYGIVFVISVITMKFTFSMFHAEQEDHAMEYLLSLPVSKYSIMGFKLIPRFSILALLCAIYILIEPTGRSITGNDPSIFVHPMVLPMTVFNFLIFGFIAGLLGHKNGLMTIFVSVTFYTLLGGTAGLAANFIDIRNDAFNVDGWAPFFWVSSAIVNLIWWTSFSPVFQKYDLKGDNMHFKRFALLAVPWTALYVAVIIASLFIDNWLKSWIPIFCVGALLIILTFWFRFSPVFRRID